MHQCQGCKRQTEDDYTLCEQCETEFALILLSYVPWTHILHEFLDATCHYGGHAPTRTNLASAPTPLRLEILDHLDLVQTTAQGLWRQLEGVNPLKFQRDLCPDLIGNVTDIAASPKLARIPDAGMYLYEFRRLKSKTLAIIDRPDEAKPVGNCLSPLCGVELYATDEATQVTCSICGSTWQTTDIRIDLLKRSINSSKCFTAGECARLLQSCGYKISRKTITSWKTRGLITPSDTDEAGKPLYLLASVVERLQCGTPEN